MKKPMATEIEVIARAKKLCIWTEQFQKALNLAKLSHGPKSRDDGQPYLTQHVFPLTIAAIDYFVDSPSLEVIATTMLLHDILEDDNAFLYTEEQLKNDFSEEVANNVCALHKRHKNKKNRMQKDKTDEHAAFVNGLRQATNEIKILKMFDRINNLECTEVVRDPEKYVRYLYDTQTLYLPLAKELDEELAKKMQREIDRIENEIATVHSPQISGVQ